MLPRLNLFRARGILVEDDGVSKCVHSPDLWLWLLSMVLIKSWKESTDSIDYWYALFYQYSWGDKDCEKLYLLQVEMAQK